MIKSSFIEHHLLLKGIKNWHVEIKRIGFVNWRLKLIQSQRLVYVIPYQRCRDPFSTMKSFSSIHLEESFVTSKREALSHSRHLKVHLAARRIGISFVYRFDQSRSIAVIELAKKTREVEEPRWKFHFARNTDGHWFLVLASASDRSQTYWTRKRVLIVQEKRNLGGQNVRRETASR